MVPISIKVLPMVSLVQMVMPMVPLVSHMVPLVKLTMVTFGEPQTESLAEYTKCADLHLDGLLRQIACFHMTGFIYCFIISITYMYNAVFINCIKHNIK